MIVRYGNTAPVFIKNHGPDCIPECPARHEVITGYEPVLDKKGSPVLDESGAELQTPVVEQVHDGTRERVVVTLDDGETERISTSDIAVENTDEAKALWLDRAFLSIVDGVNGAWTATSDSPPAWVESDWPELQQRLAAWWNCPIGEPTKEG